MDLMFKQDSLRVDDTLSNLPCISVGVEFDLKRASSDELQPPLSPSKISLHVNPSAVKIDAEIDVEIPSKKEQPRVKQQVATMHQKPAVSPAAVLPKQDNPAVSGLPTKREPIQLAATTPATTPEAAEAAHVQTDTHSVGKRLGQAQLEILLLKAQLTKSTKPELPAEEEPPEAEDRQQWRQQKREECSMYFDRYDLDESGTLNDADELRYLTIAVVKANNLKLTIPEMDQLITPAMHNVESGGTYTLDEFMCWFYDDILQHGTQHISL